MEEETMERVVSSATPVKFVPNGGLEQNSTGDSTTSSSSSPLRSDEKVQSRYLSPHMASCHDFCKYGKKHDSDAEARRLNFRKLLKKKVAQNGEQNVVTILVPGERRTRTVTKPKVISKVETQFPDNTEVLKPHTPPSMKSSIASGEKKTLQTSLENEQGRVKSLKNPGDEKKVKTIGGTPLPPLQSEPSPHLPNVIKLEGLSPVPDMDASEQPKIIKEKSKHSVKKPIAPVVPKVIQKNAPPSGTEPPKKIKQKVPVPPKRVDGAGKPAIALKTKTPLIRSISLKSSRSLIARRNQEHRIIRPSLGTSKDGGRELSKPSTASSSSKSLWNLITQRNQDNKLVKSLPTSKIDERKILKPVAASVSFKTPRNNASSLQPRKLRSIKRTSTPLDTILSLQPRKLRSIKGNSTPQDNVSSLQPGKLRNIKRTSAPQESVSSLRPRKLWNVRQTSKPSEAVLGLQPRKLRSMKQSSSMKDKDKVEKAYTESKSGNNDSYPNPKIEESESSISGVSDEKIKGNNKVEVLKEDEKKRSRRTATAPARSEDNTSTPFKLKFRRGKVINLRSDSIGARRLWFNIGWLASNNSNGNGLLGRRSFRRKRDNTSLDSKDPDSQVQSVVLKHQDVMEKKDAQSLFNHVIEETASKLVETRKSKVKALVGAFETVISLQESKPASAV